jgi:uncharacterized DUF497 family protein
LAGNGKYNAGTRILERPPAELFDWDDANRRHLARHAVSPQEAEQCYRHDPLIVEEQVIQWRTLVPGLGRDWCRSRLAFVFTIRGPRVRIVTAYAMTPQQREIYEEG